MSDNGNWNIDLLIKFQDFWDYDALGLNHRVWFKVFEEIQSEKTMIKLLSELS